MNVPEYSALEMAHEWRKGYGQGYEAGFREGRMTPEERAIRDAANRTMSIALGEATERRGME